MNLPPLQAEARLQSDIKATKTIAITIVAYVLCYVPGIIYAVLGLQNESLADSWFAFIAWYSINISCAVNPVIYYLRTNHFHSALKQLFKDPLGSSDFKERPNCRGIVNGRGNGEKGNVKAMAKKLDGGTAEGGDARGIQVNGSETVQNYSGERMNGVLILSVKSLDPDNCSCHDGDGSEHEERKEQIGEAHASNLQVPNACQRKCEETEEKSEEVSKKCGLGKEPSKRQPFSSRKKVHPL